MKNITIFISVLFLLCKFSLHAQNTTQGTDFWLTFGENSDPALGWDTTVTNIDMRIHIVNGNKATTGTIYFTKLGISVPFSIAAGQVYTYNLNNTEKQAVYNTITEISNRSIHITTNERVSVYAINRREYTADAALILPVAVLDTNYYVISYASIFWGYSANDACAVIATQNNTKVYHNNSLMATLNAGQVYHRKFEDMTGTHVTADKPIALFALNRMASIPSIANDQTLPCDHLFEQLAAVKTWGKNFFVPVSVRKNDIIRIVASENGTNITQIGGTLLSPSWLSTGWKTTLTNLNAGEWVELEVSTDSNGNGCYIQADKPVGICTYFTGCGYKHNGSPLIGCDPSQAWLPAIEQRIKSAVVVPFPLHTYSQYTHYALIITPTATKNNTTVSIGGATPVALSGGIWYDHVSGYSFYNMPLCGVFMPGFCDTTLGYLFTNSVGGLIVMGYGLGNQESYYPKMSIENNSIDYQ